MTCRSRGVGCASERGRSQRDYKGVTRGLQRDHQGVTKGSRRDHKGITKGSQRDHEAVGHAPPEDLRCVREREWCVYERERESGGERERESGGV